MCLVIKLLLKAAKIIPKNLQFTTSVFNFDYGVPTFFK
jgi:hypothetical protein